MNQVQTKQLYDFFPAAVSAHTTDRTSQLTASNFEDEAVLAKVLAQMDMYPSKIFYPRQTHSDTIYHVPEEANGDVEADALITRCPQTALVIRTADCLPVFLYDPVHRVIGLVHAGWKGSQKKITAKTVRKMEALFNTDPAQLHVAFGPCIRKESYQVGVEFWDYFPKHIVQREGKYYLDLIRANLDQLVLAGVEDNHIHDCGICTYQSSDYFSYRREGAASGRMLSVFMLNN